MKTFLEPLAPAEERECVERFQQGDKEAKDILIERNLRLVAHIAKKYYSENRDNEDLISIGIVGLIKAVNTYNPSRGNRLVTYASKCIEKAILSRWLRRCKNVYSRGGRMAGLEEMERKILCNVQATKWFYNICTIVYSFLSICYSKEQSEYL